MSRCILKNNDIINDKYKIIKKLGKGSYSNVYLCKYLSKDINCAIKINKKGPRYMSFIEEEKNILFKLNRIIKTSNIKYYIPELYNIFNYNDHICFNLKVYGLDLYKIISTYYNTDFYNSQFIISSSYKIIKGMMFLKDNDIIHCDLKPENIMYTIDKKDLVICDFSLSIDSKKDYEQYVYPIQSIWYRSPEIALKLNYNYKIDIWSLGTIIYEILYEKSLIKCRNDDNMDLIYQITSILNYPSLKLVKSQTNWYSFFQIRNNKVMLLKNNEKIVMKKIYVEKIYKKFNKKIVDILLKIIDLTLKWDRNERYDYDKLLNLFN